MPFFFSKIHFILVMGKIRNSICEMFFEFWLGACFAGSLIKALRAHYSWWSSSVHACPLLWVSTFSN